jgi:hypothetical protein
MAGDLGRLIAEHIWGLCRPLHLAGQDYEPAGGDEVPGYEDDHDAVLLRRKSDGQVFEAWIDVTVQPVLTPEQREARAARLRTARRANP